MSYSVLGIELEEIPDWNCCGSTSGHMTSELLPTALSVEIILWAQERGLDVVAPCAACSSALKTAFFRLKEDAELKETVEGMVEAEYTGTVAVRNGLDVVADDYGLDRLKGEVKMPLAGLKAACYYGCLLTRPPDIKQFDDPESPVVLDNVIQALGAETVDWSHKTVCCGASFSANDPRTAWKLSHDVLVQAKKAGAECMVVACPLCHVNLDLNQEDIEKEYDESIRLPVFYFSQLLGLSLGAEPRSLGLDKNVVEPWGVLSKFIEVNVEEYR